MPICNEKKEAITKRIDRNRNMRTLGVRYSKPLLAELCGHMSKMLLTYAFYRAII